ncbi:hypothetical protein E6O75_ATG01000 [Venturia nashicola]|uniref:Uncharacterized protein n=1 Tax=Venturia nashicola TaxID=86259 RepID=A0A4Z1PTA3_9PEZI|nr:hypothetical protein E6O75_ATG01000 [Venturia nashicola]
MPSRSCGSICFQVEVAAFKAKNSTAAGAVRNLCPYAGTCYFTHHWLVVSLARKQAAPVPFHCRVSRESSARARLHFWQHESEHSPINNTTNTSTIVADHFISVAVLPSIQIISHHLCDTRQARKPEDSSSPREVFTTFSNINSPDSHHYQLRFKTSF